MKEPVKIGIIICDRYRSCAGGKCLRAMRNREGTFSRYQGREIELVGYTTCDGCPGGNIEYAPAEIKNNGAEVIHLATGLLVGYPPCPYLDHFEEFIPQKFGLKVVSGTHPIPVSYLAMHSKLKTWNTPKWKKRIGPLLGDEELQLSYS